MLRNAIVVAHDRPGADVAVFTGRRVAEISKVIRFGPGTEAGLFGLDEVAYLHVFTEFGTRPQPRKGPELAAGADHRAIDHGMWMDHRTIADPRILDDAPRRDPHSLAKRHPPFEHHVYVDDAVDSCGQIAAYVDARRITQRNSIRHQARCKRR